MCKATVDVILDILEKPAKTLIINSRIRPFPNPIKTISKKMMANHKNPPQKSSIPESNNRVEESRLEKTLLVSYLSFASAVFVARSRKFIESTKNTKNIAQNKSISSTPKRSRVGLVSDTRQFMFFDIERAFECFFSS